MNLQKSKGIINSVRCSWSKGWRRKKSNRYVETISYESVETQALADNNIFISKYGIENKIIVNIIVHTMG